MNKQSIAMQKKIERLEKESEARRKMLKKCEGLLGVCKPGIAKDGDYDKIKLEIYGLRNEILEALAKEG